MFQVGLTGGIGSGKTLVSSVLKKLGVPVYDADSQARRIMNEDSRLRQGIVGLFGEEAYLDGSLNRSYLAGRVFGNTQMLSSLNNLVHPAVRKDYSNWLSRQTAPYVVEEAAILFESGANRMMDMTILVYAPVDVRINRVMKRDGIGEDQVRERMKHQLDEEEKRRLSDKVITNDEREMLLPQIIAVHQEIMEQVRNDKSSPEITKLKN
jgi:dephospho-CoA kinase